MQGPSLYYFIDQYTTKLQRVLDGTIKEEDIFPAKDPSENKSADIKKSVLDKIYRDIQKAPMYYLALEPVEKFTKTMEKYVEEETSNSPAKKTANKINELIKNRGETILSTFRNDKVKYINQILDKNDKDLTPDENTFLLDIANILALSRGEYQTFCKSSAIIAKITELQKNHPGVIYKYNSLNERYVYINHEVFLTTPQDFYFYLLVNFTIRNRGETIYKDETFITKIIEKAVRAENTQLRLYLEQFLGSYIIESLCTQFDAVKSEKFHKIDQYLSTAFSMRSDLYEYANEFMRAPQAYLDYYRNREIVLRPIDFQLEGHEQIAKEFSEYIHEDDLSFDRFYQAIYGKLERQAVSDASVGLPIYTPQEYSKLSDFFTKEQVDVSRYHEVEREKQKYCLLDNDNNVSPVKKSKKPKKKKTYKPKSKIQSGNKKSSPSKEKIKEAEEQSVLVPETIPERSPTVPETRPLETKQELLKEPLVDTPIQQQKEMDSPLLLHERVNRWFDDKRDCIQEDENYRDRSLTEEKRKDIYFLHNFALAADSVIWEYGLKYNRESQPALAMLCQVEGIATEKSELFRATYTFDHKLEEKQPPPHYDSSWECYHRTLTRMKQEELVEEYIQCGVYENIDFPALPSQQMAIAFPSTLLNQPFSDGSFVEKVEGGVITVQDPKNDRRLHFFVVR